MSVLLLASLGGVISAISTSVGALLTPLFSCFQKLHQYQMSMDFALGVMLSAAAFSLIGPELMKGEHLNLILPGLLSGWIFIYLIHLFISRSQKGSLNSYQVLLISALIFHNLPEGMGAGASLAGMKLQEAIPLQIAISIQNVAEGLLLTMLLRGLGLSLFHSVVGAMTSGLMEMSGAMVAGLVLEKTLMLLPFFLSVAGGAMMTSVLMEFQKGRSLKKSFRKTQFLSGLMIIPITNFIIG